jgi:hypothetical protein
MLSDTCVWEWQEVSACLGVSVSDTDAAYPLFNPTLAHYFAALYLCIRSVLEVLELPNFLLQFIASDLLFSGVISVFILYSELSNFPIFISVYYLRLTSSDVI